MNIKVAMLGDSAKRHTGFGTVNAQIAMGFHEAGYEVHMYGFLDNDTDSKGVLPYTFHPTPVLDDLGHRTFGLFLRKVKPDVIFILTDPGNLFIYTYEILNRNAATYTNEFGQEYIPPIVAYAPIEAAPMPEDHGEAMGMVKGMGGEVVVYCESAKRLVNAQFPGINPCIIPHGLDHANFRRYNDEDRHILRELIGWDNKFVVGSVGVNKRTKGFTTLIYAAQIMREKGWDKDLLFYCHTNPTKSTMEGYRLKELTKYYGVEDLFLFKPILKERNYWLGVERDNNTLEQARKIAGQVPEDPGGRAVLFATYDFVSMLNCLDLYVDCSQVEGWGLPLGEAMACGVPCISIDDDHVRKEVYRLGPVWVKPQPKRLWETWHSGGRLVTVDPERVADAIHSCRAGVIDMDKLSDKGLQAISSYSWKPSQKAFVDLLAEVVERDREQCRDAFEKEKALE